MSEGSFKTLIQDIDSCERIVSDNWSDPIGKQYLYWVNETLKRLKKFDADIENLYKDLEKIYEDCENVSSLVSDEEDTNLVKVKKFSRR